MSSSPPFDDGRIGLEIAMACDRELEGAPEPITCDRCGLIGCNKWCEKHTSENASERDD